MDTPKQQVVTTASTVAPVSVGVVLVVPSPTSSEKKPVLRSLMPAPPPYSYKTPSPCFSSPLKPPKKFRSVPEKILRCKRRIEFGQLSSVLDKPRVSSQLRRNERERKRVGIINNTFAHLRQHVPDDYCNPNNTKNTKKLSKVDTLRGAIQYIKVLQGLLEDDSQMKSAFAALTNAVTSSHGYTPASEPPASAPPVACPPLTLPRSSTEPDLTLLTTPPPAVFATHTTGTAPPPLRSAPAGLPPVAVPGLLQPINLDSVANHPPLQPQPLQPIVIQPMAPAPCEPETLTAGSLTHSTSNNENSCAGNTSPHSSMDSDYGDAPLSPEDEDLLSFATMWLQDQK